MNETSEPVPTPTPEEKLPISDMITVLEYETIYKTQKWWSAVVLGEQFGRRKVFLYLWFMDPKTNGWKRKQKSTITSTKDFDKISEAVRKYLQKIGA